MSALLAICGNRCDLCPLYRDNFEKLGAEAVNAGLYKYYQGGTGDPPNYDRACDGCAGAGYQVRADCATRACATERGLRNCAGCADVICALLEADMNAVEGAARRFGETMPAEDFKIFVEPFLTRARLSELRARA